MSSDPQEKSASLVSRREGALRRYQHAYRNVPGWFSWLDYRLFSHLLGIQQELGTHGDLLEIGAYQGRSAILIGLFARPGETVTVVDTFDSGGVSEANRLENRRSYTGLRRAQFDRHYDRYGIGAPRVIQEDSASAVDRLAPASQRFVHVDGSHLYDVVAKDIDNAVRLSVSEGLVVCDDYRSAHTPGVAAAVWAAVYEGHIYPLLASPQKLYACLSREAVGVYRRRLRTRLAGDAAVAHTRQSVLGNEIALVDGVPAQRRLCGLQQRLPGALGRALDPLIPPMR